MDKETYVAQTLEQFNSLLSSSAEEECFQKFFEANPFFVPGAFEVTSQSGHTPYYGALFSQPRIFSEKLRKTGKLIRIPDFLWLAQHSSTFCPVFIEIEAPEKKYFKKTKNNSPEFYYKFHQAYNQIEQWQAIMQTEDARTLFYETFSIPERLRSLAFEPQYCLVYGRSAEYENDSYRSNMISNKSSGSVKVFSYDKLPRLIYTNIDYAIRFYTVNRQGENNVVKNIPPLFGFCVQFGADDFCEGYNALDENSFIAAINAAEMSDERKEFLKKRFLEKWKGFKPDPKAYPNILSSLFSDEYFE